MQYSLKVNETETGKEGLLTFEGDMTIIHAREIKKALLEAFATVDLLGLNIKTIESADISFVQLICASHREAFLTGKKIIFQGSIGTILKEIFFRAGYCKQYGCPTDVKETCMWQSLCQ